MWTVPLGKISTGFTPSVTFIFTAVTLTEPQRHAHPWVTTQWCCSYVKPFLLPLESALKLAIDLLGWRLFEMHNVFFGASRFPLPAAHQDTVTLAICSVGLATDKLSPFKPSFLLLIVLVLVCSRSVFLSPDALCLSEMRVAALKQNQTFFPVACEASAAEHWPGSRNFIVLLI